MAARRKVAKWLVVFLAFISVVIVTITLLDETKKPTGTYYYVNGFGSCIPVKFNNESEMVATGFESCGFEGCEDKTTHFCREYSMVEISSDGRLLLACPSKEATMSAADQWTEVYEVRQVKEGYKLIAEDHFFTLFTALSECALTLNNEEVQFFSDKVIESVAKWNAEKATECEANPPTALLEEIFCNPLSEEGVRDTFYGRPMVNIGKSWDVSIKQPTMEYVLDDSKTH